MALFSKPPAKKPDPPKPEPRVRAVAPGARRPSARDVVSELAGRPGGVRPLVHPAEPEIAQGVTTGQSSVSGAKVGGAPAARAAIEVEQAHNDLCPALENAALLFASGQAKPARDLLEDAVAQDPEARTSNLAWHGLFDLLRRAGDRGAFDRAALQYVVQFERSAPSWEELGGPATGERTASTGGYIALTGKLTAASTAQTAMLDRVGSDAAAQAKLDLAGVAGFDDAGARLLADALGSVRRRRAGLAVERPEKLRAMLEQAVNQGREAGEGPWLLLLELLQWTGEQATFDDRAVEYAVTFELSPPSWEPPVPPGPPMPTRKPTRTRRVDAEVLAWSDEITGSAPPAVAELLEFAQARSNVLLDMAHVERIDFVGGGAFANALQRLQAGRKNVQIVGASPIVRALLLLIGVSSDLFIRKAA